MSDRRPCIRCRRDIDAWAKICPYCNQDQTAPVPAEDPMYSAAAYVPPEENKLKKRLLMGAGGIVMVIVMFAVGFAILNHKNSLAKEPEVKEGTPEAAPAPARPSSDVTLVPTSEVPTSSDLVEAPITSAPAANAADDIPTEYQRTDATAVASDEYAQMAARDAAAKKRQQALVDPRSIGGVSYNQGAQPRSFPRSMASSAVEPVRRAASTRPVPQYQPLPNIRVSQNVTARLDLVVGSDGRVKEVNLRDSIPGESARLIAAVQAWRFKPATQNGAPVAAPFTVDISFHANE